MHRLGSPSRYSYIIINDFRGKFLHQTERTLFLQSEIMQLQMRIVLFESAFYFIPRLVRVFLLFFLASFFDFFLLFFLLISVFFAYWFSLVATYAKPDGTKGGNANAAKELSLCTLNAVDEEKPMIDLLPLLLVGM